MMKRPALPDSRTQEAGDSSTAPIPNPSSRVSTFSSLRYRDYRLLWFSTLCSSSGQWIQQTSIGWLTYQVTGSPFLLGAVNGLQSLPLLFLAPIGGVLADRLERRRLMLSTQLSLVLLTASFATLVLAGYAQVWNIILFTLLTGVAWAFNMPVRQSVIPDLVPRRDLMNAIALSSAGYNVTRIVGPSLAGLLIVAISVAGNFYLQSFAYVGVALMVWRMYVPSRPLAGPQVSIQSNLLAGARYVWRHPALRAQMSLALVPVVIALPYVSLLPVFAQDVLHVGPGGFGLMMAAPGIGAVIGTLTLASVGNVRRKGLLLFASLTALAIALILFAESRSFPLSLGLLMLIGGFQMTYLTTNQTLLQLTIPDEFRGRVMGIYMLNQGLVPAGSLITGTLADLWSAPLAIIVMASAVLVLCALAFAFLPSMRKA
jgi:MFS family permease